MKINTVYYGLTEQGRWIWFTTKEEIYNDEQASKIINEPIKKVHKAPTLYQICRFYLPKDGYKKSIK